jgi:hypothetical protein
MADVQLEVKVPAWHGGPHLEICLGYPDLAVDSPPGRSCSVLVVGLKCLHRDRASAVGHRRWYSGSQAVPHHIEEDQLALDDMLLLVDTSQGSGDGCQYHRAVLHVVWDIGGCLSTAQSGVSGASADKEAGEPTRGQGCLVLQHLLVSESVLRTRQRRRQLHQAGGGLARQWLRTPSDPRET